MEPNRIFIPLLLTLILGACSKQKERANTSYAHIEQRIDSVAKDFIDGGKVKGLSIAVLSNGKTIYNKGFGFMDSSEVKPVTNQSVFLMASISKLIGSVVVMKLVEEGRLNLDQTLYELLPDFPNEKQAKKISLRSMLSHTSGLQDYASEIDTLFIKTGIAPSKEDFYNFFRERDLLFEPGEDYSYCNSGFLLMSMIIERITGNTYQSEIDRVVNLPAGLNLKLIAETVDNPNTSNYFELTNSGLEPRPHWTWIKGDGGLTTTSLDLAHFPSKWNSGSIISHESVKEMIKPTILNDGVETGYGLGVRSGIFAGLKMIGHTGGNKTLLSKMVYFPEKDITIVVFVNTDNTSSNARSVFGEVALTILDEDVPDYSEDEIIGEHLKIYEGVYDYKGYKFDTNISIMLNPEDSHLYYCSSETECEKMYNLGNGEFWIEKWPLDKIVFDITDTGEVRALREYYIGYYVMLRKKKG
ncbi:MAG: serine hydrolase domain-containing protein [Imperialibacter sp.]|uniref:serine hydrolase domain-containing protein n=1 Tax=Imperialibacter sp. TaxID=2038411 RepID=UPI0032EE4464